MRRFLCSPLRAEKISCCWQATCFPAYSSIPHWAIGFILLTAPLYVLRSATALSITVVAVAALNCSVLCFALRRRRRCLRLWPLWCDCDIRQMPNTNSENPVYPKKAACTDVVAQAQVQAARRTRCFAHKSSRRAAPLRIVIRIASITYAYTYIFTTSWRCSQQFRTAVVSVYITEMNVMFSICLWVCACGVRKARANSINNQCSHTCGTKQNQTERWALNTEHTKAAPVILRPNALTPGPGSARRWSDVFDCGFSVRRHKRFSASQFRGKANNFKKCKLSLVETK